MARRLRAAASASPPPASTSPMMRTATAQATKSTRKLRAPLRVVLVQASVFRRLLSRPTGERRNGHVRKKTLSPRKCFFSSPPLLIPSYTPVHKLGAASTSARLKSRRIAFYRTHLLSPFRHRRGTCHRLVKRNGAQTRRRKPMERRWASRGCVGSKRRKWRYERGATRAPAARLAARRVYKGDLWGSRQHKSPIKTETEGYEI